jgi:hypothetical protein
MEAMSVATASAVLQLPSLA